jgi:hypothetical protein
MGIVGLSPDINGSWTVDVTGPTTFTIRGTPIVTGSVAVQGHILISSEEWSDPVAEVKSLHDLPTTLQSGIGAYCFQEGYLHFPPQSGDPALIVDTTEIKVVYSLSGSLQSPTATAVSTELDDSLNFLSHAAASAYLSIKGTKEQAAEYRGLAGGYLLDLLRPHIRQMQLGESTVPAPFRASRNIRPYVC